MSTFTIIIKIIIKIIKITKMIIRCEDGEHGKLIVDGDRPDPIKAG